MLTNLQAKIEETIRFQSEFQKLSPEEKIKRMQASVGSTKRRTNAVQLVRKWR